MVLLSTLMLQAPPPQSIGGSIFNFLEKYEAQQLIFPFLLTFVIIYGVLDMIKLFNNRINGIIALSVSFFAIFYGPYGAMGTFLTQLYGTGAVVVVGIVIFMIILGALSLGGPRRPGEGLFARLFGETGGTIAGIGIVAVLIFLLGSGWFEGMGIVLDPDTTALMIIVMVILLLFYILTRPPDKTRAWWNNMFPPHPDEP